MLIFVEELYMHVKYWKFKERNLLHFQLIKLTVCKYNYLFST